MATKFDTIVVGCGAAGLAAISSLGKSGKRVLGLEAADKIGGRVCTENFGNGKVELGAEWIHGTESNVVFNTAMAHSVTVLPQDIGFTFLHSDGTQGDYNKLNQLLGFCFGIRDFVPETPELSGYFITEKCDQYVKASYPRYWNDKEFMTEFYEFINLLVCNYDASNDWNDTSTASTYESLGGHQHMSWHQLGYETLFDILLNKYQTGAGFPTVQISVYKEVSNINWLDGDGLLKVSCTDGTKYVADNVIVTVSLGVLKERHTSLFTPPLPKTKMDAINRLTMGVMDKIVLSYESPWWPKNKNMFFGFIWKTSQKESVPDNDKWMTKILGASRPMGCGNALTLWTSGEIAKLVENLPEREVMGTCTKLLQMFFNNDSIPLPTEMLRSKWYSNPLTRGSYSFDSLLAQFYPTAREDLAAPICDKASKPKLMFAGEATHQKHFSTVHGAMETGYREAERILAGRTLSKL